MGGIQGLDAGLGTLAGMLLRGYQAGQYEEERRKALEMQAQMMGIQLPPAEERGYLNRVLSPRAGSQRLDLQQALLNSVMEQRQKVEAEQRKQGAMYGRQSQIEKEKSGYKSGLEKEKAGYAQDLEQYRRTTPQALTPEALESYRAGAGASRARGSYYGARTGQVKAETGMMNQILDRMQGGPQSLGGAVGASMGLPVPGQPGYEYVPSMRAGPVSLTPQKTQEREIEDARRVSEARAGTKPLSGEQAKRYESLQSLGRFLDEAEKHYNTAFVGPFVGRVKEARRQLPEEYGGLGEAQVNFYQSMENMRNRLLYALSGAQINEAEYRRLLRAMPQETDDPRTFLAGVTRFKTELHATIEETERVARTPRSDLGKSQDPHVDVDISVGDDEDESWQRANDALDLLRQGK